MLGLVRSLLAILWALENSSCTFTSAPALTSSSTALFMGETINCGTIHAYMYVMYCISGWELGWPDKIGHPGNGLPLSRY